MTVVVSGPEVEAKDITGYNLASGRPLIDEDREIVEYRGMTFQTNYDQEVFPFPTATKSVTSMGLQENHVSCSLSCDAIPPLFRTYRSLASFSRR